MSDVDRELVERGTVFVCVTCRRNGEALEPKEARSGARLHAALRRAIEADSSAPDLVAVECLSNCTRACTVAVTGPAKWTYVIGELDPELHADDVLAFARLHRHHPEGLPAWRERPEHVRKNTIARVPPLPLLRSVRDEDAA